jgi:hypothetical protein
MKDENDVQTEDAFITFEELERQDLVITSLATGGHYQAVKPATSLKVSGRRFLGSNTPDAIKDLWSTPGELVDFMENRYGPYDLDAAASANNAVCEKFFDEKTNCLKRWWGSKKHVWLNPPFSNPLPFVEKAAEQARNGNQIDVLLNADSSTAWFRLAQMRASEIIWIVADIDYHITDDEVVIDTAHSGRLAFTNADSGEAVSGNSKGQVMFIFREMKEGEQQQTHYISIGEICPSVKNKRKRKVSR